MARRHSRNLTTMNSFPSTVPLVAVATPVYNGEAFLAETMACVQRQTYPNLIHVLSENASTDATPQIIDSFANGRVPLSVRHQKTLLDQVDNWNAVADLVPAEAKYFRLLCADDVIDPTAIEKTVAVAEKDPEVSIVGTLQNRSGRVEDFFWEKDREIFDGAEAIRRCLRNQGTVFATHLLWRRSLLDRHRPFFDPKVVEHDTDSALRSLLGAKFGFVHECLGMTRVHPGAYTSTYYPTTHDNFSNWLIFMTRYGPEVFDESEFQPLLRRYRMYHLRKMLQWRIKDGNTAAFRDHAEWMKRLGYTVGPKDFAAAMIDWAGKRLGFRTGWAGHPF